MNSVYFCVIGFFWIRSNAITEEYQSIDLCCGLMNEFNKILILLKVLVKISIYLKKKWNLKIGYKII